MSLEELVDNSRTDKNTTHSYLSLYEKLLAGKKYTAKNVLEIGIGDGNQGATNGGSIKLWHDYFVNADVYALDIQHINAVWDGLKHNDRIKLYTSMDAYDEDTAKHFADTKFDYILDDGPHTLESMLKCVQLYSPLLTDDGILIIEDVQDFSWLHVLCGAVPENLHKFIKMYDLRKVKGRYDDIVFTINKST
jgi:predicted O-methyltransferase YrrM